MRPFELSPLRFDNPLAFLALLGLMRVLDASRPAWRVRAFWRRRGGHGPWVPVIEADGACGEDELAEAAVAGLRDLAAPVAEVAARWNGGTDPAALLGEAARRPRDSEAVTALLGETLVRERRKGREIRRLEARPSPFLPKPKSGQQNLLARIAALTHGLDADPSGTGSAGIRDLLRECLFEAWRPRSSQLSLRWDPGEYRPWATRWQDPSQEPAETVEGAVRLAVLALPLFPLHPADEGARAPGFVDASPRTLRLRWPVWTPPARPAAVSALLTHPALVARRIDVGALAPHGVVEVMETRVIWLGDPPNDYPNFTPATPLWGGEAGGPERPDSPAAA